MILDSSYRRSLNCLVTATLVWLLLSSIRPASASVVGLEREDDGQPPPPMSPLLTPQQVIQYLHKGHVVLRDILTEEFRAPNFLEEYQKAEKQASKEFETFFLKAMKCESNTERLHRWRLLIDVGSGKRALKECTDYVWDQYEERRIEREALQEAGEWNDEEDWTELDEEPHPPFYQLNSIHEHSPQIHQMATAPKLAAIAATLMQVPTARLYQTRAFQKIPPAADVDDLWYEQNTFNHVSYMHADLEIVPLDTNAYVTIWCPATRNLTKEDSVLTYASQSHNDIARTKYYNLRDYQDENYVEEEEEVYEEEEEEEQEEESDEEDAAEEQEGEYEEQSTSVDAEQEGDATTTEQEEHSEEEEEYQEVDENQEIPEDEEEEEEEPRLLTEDERLEMEYKHLKSDTRYNIEWYDDLNVGDCVAHHGWLMHGSTSQMAKNGPRDAITFAYIDGQARKIPPADERQGKKFRYTREIHFQNWYNDIEEGQVVDHPRLPLVWPPAAEEPQPEQSPKEEAVE